jgi:hypothetical protein
MAACVSKLWKNEFEEEEEGGGADEGHDQGTVRRILAALQADGAKKKTGKPKVRPSNHCGFREAIEEKSVDANGDDDARDEDKFVNGFHTTLPPPAAPPIHKD